MPDLPSTVPADPANVILRVRVDSDRPVSRLEWLGDDGPGSVDLPVDVALDLIGRLDGGGRDRIASLETEVSRLIASEGNIARERAQAEAEEERLAEEVARLKAERETLAAAPPECRHPLGARYSVEHDNFYCRTCNRGMGDDYYTANRDDFGMGRTTRPALSDLAKATPAPTVAAFDLPALAPGGGGTMCAGRLNARVSPMGAWRLDLSGEARTETEAINAVKCAHALLTGHATAKAAPVAEAAECPGCAGRLAGMVDAICSTCRAATIDALATEAPSIDPAALARAYLDTADMPRDPDETGEETVERRLRRALATVGARPVKVLTRSDVTCAVLSFPRALTAPDALDKHMWSKLTASGPVALPALDVEALRQAIDEHDKYAKGRRNADDVERDAFRTLAKIRPVLDAILAANGTVTP